MPQLPQVILLQPSDFWVGMLQPGHLRAVRPITASDCASCCCRAGRAGAGLEAGPLMQAAGPGGTMQRGRGARTPARARSATAA